VGAQHVVVEDVDLRLTARGRVRRQMTDAFGAELEERIVDLARICKLYPAELSWELQLWSTDDVEVHDLVAGVRQQTNNPPSGPFLLSRRLASRELPSIDLQFELGTPVSGLRDSRIKIPDERLSVRCEASRMSDV
jgi:hypothetical protein